MFIQWPDQTRNTKLNSALLSVIRMWEKHWPGVFSWFAVYWRQHIWLRASVWFIICFMIWLKLSFKRYFLQICWVFSEKQNGGWPFFGFVIKMISMEVILVKLWVLWLRFQAHCMHTFHIWCVIFKVKNDH